MVTIDQNVTSPLLEGFLAAIEAGRGADLGKFYAPDATADLTVPNWRLHRTGSARIASEFARWFADPGRFEELRVLPTPVGFVVTYLLSWEEGGVPHAAHHCHVVDVVDGQIRHDTVFCGGRWSAERLARMEEAAHAG